jgi:hypothetical protein
MPFSRDSTWYTLDSPIVVEGLTFGPREEDMSTWLMMMHAALAGTAFLAVLNGYLRGAAKAKIDAFLSLVWVGLLVTVVLFFGWRHALIALGLSFVYAMAANPLARILARKMLGYRTTMASDGDDTDYSVEGLLRRSDATDKRLQSIASKPGVARVLTANGLQAGDLKEQYWFLMSSGLGDLAWEIVSTPSDLQMLLNMRRDGVEPIEIAARLMRAG